MLSKRETNATPRRLTAIAVTFALVLLLALLFVHGMLPPSGKKLGPLALGFFVTELPSYALFYCGGIVAAFELWRGQTQGAFHRFLVWGFVLYSASQVMGALWCYYGWGNTFRWSARHMASASIWLAYAAYLHLRFVPWWTARRRAFFAVSAACLTFGLTTATYLLASLAKWVVG
ncbi:MAG: cytochrome c biogenesis protein [Myxococcota bacterium]|jgi:ABC-type transport system involved in cytochrome c biogenesis permease subunit|nr:cytochrome c biogenesis protein [Myxococcota bacterium]